MHTIETVWKGAVANHKAFTDTGDAESDIRFLTLGLTGEAGELANFVKKRWTYGESHTDAIRFEIADVVAYAFMLADSMGMTPTDLLATMSHKQTVYAAKMAARRIK